MVDTPGHADFGGEVGDQSDSFAGFVFLFQLYAFSFLEFKWSFDWFSAL